MIRQIIEQLGVEAEIDPILYLSELNTHKQFSRFSEHDWRELLSARRSERFVALLFVLRGYFENPELALFFGDFFPDFEQQFGEYGYAISSGCCVEYAICKRRCLWIEPLAKLLSSRNALVGARLEEVARLGLAVQSDFKDFYDDAPAPGRQVIFSRFRSQEFLRSELKLLLGDLIPKGCLSFIPVRTVAESGRKDAEWFFYYRDNQVRAEDDFRPVHRSALEGLPQDALCSPIPNSLAERSGSWHYIHLFGHLCLEVRQLAGGTRVLRHRSPLASELVFTRFSPTITLVLFQPYDRQFSEALVLDVRRSTPVGSFERLSCLEKKRIADAIAFHLELYGSEITIANHRLKLSCSRA